MLTIHSAASSALVQEMKLRTNGMKVIDTARKQYMCAGVSEGRARGGVSIIVPER